MSWWEWLVLSFLLAVVVALWFLKEPGPLLIEEDAETPLGLVEKRVAYLERRVWRLECEMREQEALTRR